jgi:hypothetical protein
MQNQNILLKNKNTWQVLVVDVYDQKITIQGQPKKESLGDPHLNQ